MHTLSLMGARLRECRADPQLWNAAEVAEVPGHEFQVVVERCGGNLEIGVGQNAAIVLKVGLGRSVDSGNIEIIRNHREGREHPGFDVPDVSRGVRRTECTPEQFADHHGARELVSSRNRLEPAHVLGERLRSEDLGDRIRIEEIGHSAVQPRRTPCSRSPQLRQRPDKLLRSLPAAGQGSQTSTRAAASSGNGSHALHRHQHGDRLAMAGDDDLSPALGLANAFRELRLCLRCRHCAYHSVL